MRLPDTIQRLSTLRDSLRFIFAHPLGSRSKAATFARWARWQVGSRLLPGPAVVPFVNDSVLVAEPGMGGATGNVYVGIHEFADMAFLLHHARKGELFVDIGANVGSYTVLAGAALGCRVISVEPVRATYDSLVRNIRVNGIAGLVDARNIGVGKAPGTLRFTADLDCVNHVLAEGETADAIEVPVLTIDDLIRGDVASVLKIDVEGFETPALQGATNALRDGRIRALIMETNGSGNRYGFDEDALVAQLIAFGYEPCAYDPLTRSLTHLPERGHVGNLIMVRDFADASRRVKDASAFRAVGISV